MRRLVFVVLLLAVALGGCAVNPRVSLVTAPHVEENTVDRDIHAASVTNVEAVWQSIAFLDSAASQTFDALVTSAPKEWLDVEFAQVELQHANGTTVQLQRVVSRTLVCDMARNRCDTLGYPAVIDGGRYVFFMPRQSFIGTSAVIVSGDARRVLTLDGKIVESSVSEIIKNPYGFFSQHPSSISVDRLLSESEKRRVLARVRQELPLTTTVPIDGHNYWTKALAVVAAGVSNMESVEHRFAKAGGMTISSTDILTHGLSLLPKWIVSGIRAANTDPVGAWKLPEKEKSEQPATGKDHFFAVQNRR